MEKDCRLGRKIKALRIIKGLSDTDLSNETGISIEYIRLIENCTQTNITLDKLASIAKALGKDSSYLLDFTDLEKLEKTPTDWIPLKDVRKILGKNTLDILDKNTVECVESKKGRRKYRRSEIEKLAPTS